MLRRLSTSLRAINFGQVLLELGIVFIGVYLAFLLSNYQAQSERIEEQERVIELLDLGIDRYQKLFAGFVIGHEQRNQQFREQLQRNEIPNFGDVTYPAPQYPIDVITLILTDQSFGLFDIDLYVPLTAYVNAIQRLMYAEEKLVQLSEAYEPLPPTSNPNYEHLYAAQFQRAQRFLRYLEIRKRTCEELVERSEEIAGLIAQ